ncbi:MAG TPA: hypothetical protein VN228_16995, partial [Pyrinomonadaceae bacterium]|nr:hypothetical protein [Pyrinomonadaceae bacterium]
VLPRLVSAVKERSSSSVKLTGCAFLGMSAAYKRRAHSYNNYCYTALGPEIYNEIEAQYKLQDSATNSEDRPFRVAAGTADAKVKGRLANTLRDTKRMLEFIKHDAEIDLIQVDRAQWEIINQTTPVHYLSTIGLANRCFVASSLVDAVKKVSEFKR